ncbi:hypothetical protein D3C71_1736170 [compost metagenome]
MHLGDPQQEVLRVAPQDRDDRHQQEGIDGNEDRVDAILFRPEQIVVDRQGQEEGGGDRPMVGAPRVDQRDELAQRCKRAEGKEQQHPDTSGDEGDGDEKDHCPPGLDAGIQVLDRAIGSVG